MVIDPRKTETAKIADQHIFIKPATDVYLLLAILNEVLNAYLTPQPPLLNEEGSIRPLSPPLFEERGSGGEVPSIFKSAIQSYTTALLAVRMSLTRFLMVSVGIPVILETASGV